MALGSFAACYRDLITIMKDLSCISTADNARYAKLARYDCSVCGSASLIGNYGRDPSHYRFPIRIGEPGNQYITGFDVVQLFNAAHDSYATNTNLFTDCLASYKRGSMFTSDSIDLCHYIPGLCRMDSFRSGLNDEEFAAHAIFGPLDIHRLRMSGLFGIVVFN
jgi:hypothetical protein